MKYELVKYKYGLVRRYTGFCLTPKLAEARVIVRGGKTFTVTNEGASSRAARHFQRPETAKRHLGTTGQVAGDFDWCLLAETVRYA